MIGIIDTLKKIFTGSDLIFKHTLLFVFTGIVALISLPFHEMSSLENLTNTQLLTALGMFLVTVVVSIYTAGYNYRFTHNSYDNESNDIMPQWDFSLFKDGFKFFTLSIVYCIYGTLFTFLGGISLTFILGLLSSLLKIPQNIYNGCIIFTLFLLCLVLIVYVFYAILAIIDSAKERKLKGFFNPLKPFEYVKTSFSSYSILLLKLIPIYIVIYIVQALCFYLPNVITYIFTAVCGYLMAIYGLVLYYQIRQIIEYKHHKIGDVTQD